jgi:hypothetical protein
MTRTRKLKIAILQLLKAAYEGGYLMREDALVNELNLIFRPAPMLGEVKAALQEMDREHHVVGARDGDELRLSIAPAGEVWLQVQLS